MAHTNAIRFGLLVGIVTLASAVLWSPQGAAAQVDPASLPYPLFAQPTLLAPQVGGMPTLLPYNPTSPVVAPTQPSQVVVTSVAVIPFSTATTATEMELVAQLERRDIAPDDLVMIPADPSGVNTITTYYIAPDARRHAFAQPAVYNSWYDTFGTRIHPITMSELQAIPLGGNVTFRPGKNVLQFQGPDLYVVSASQTLRKLASVEAASNVFGPNWQREKIQLSDASFSDYQLSTQPPIYTRGDFDPAQASMSVVYPSDSVRS